MNAYFLQDARCLLHELSHQNLCSIYQPLVAHHNNEIIGPNILQGCLADQKRRQPCRVRLAECVF